MLTDKFTGTLTDKELGIIEDALVFYKTNINNSIPIPHYADQTITGKQITKLIDKLYKFWEVK